MDSKSICVNYDDIRFTPPHFFLTVVKVQMPAPKSNEV